MPLCTGLNIYSSFKHISSQRSFYTKTWWSLSRNNCEYQIGSLQSCTLWQGRLIEVQYAVKVKLKLKEHGLLKQNKEKRGSHRKMAIWAAESVWPSPGRNGFPRGNLRCRRADDVIDTAVGQGRMGFNLVTENMRQDSQISELRL